MLIEINENQLNQALATAVEHAIGRIMYEGSYGREAGAGYQAAEAAARDYIAGVDLAPLIRQVVAEKLDILIRDVVETTLRQRIKRTAKEMEKEGTLFEGVTEWKHPRTELE